MESSPEREPEIVLQPFQPAYKDQVVNLIVPIQREEFGVAITAEDQPDLQNIPGFYQRDAGNFWVALDAAKVVGTIALLDIGHQQAALRKMFVDKDFRGKEKGTAKRLLDELLLWAKQKGLKEVYLGTTAQFLAAQRFYEKNGFVEVPRASLPEAFPVMKVDSKFYKYSF